MIMWRSVLMFVFLCGMACAETFYVRPNGGAYGTENGSSWANAFDGWTDIVWGSGAGQLGAGDTLYVGAGNYSQRVNFWRIRNQWSANQYSGGTGYACGCGDV